MEESDEFRFLGYAFDIFQLNRKSATVVMKDTIYKYFSLYTYYPPISAEQITCFWENAIYATLMKENTLEEILQISFKTHRESFNNTIIKNEVYDKISKAALMLEKMFDAVHS